MFRYGEIVRDTITGYTGKVTARCDYFGRRPAQFLVETFRLDSHMGEWFDENRLEPSEKKDCSVYIPKADYPKAELVEEVELGRSAEQIKTNLSAMLNAKA